MWFITPVKHFGTCCLEYLGKNIEEKNISDIKFPLTLQLESFTGEKILFTIMQEIFFQLYGVKISFSLIEKKFLFNFMLETFFHFTEGNFHSI